MPLCGFLHVQIVLRWRGRPMEAAGCSKYLAWNRTSLNEIPKYSSSTRSRVCVPGVALSKTRNYQTLVPKPLALTTKPSRCLETLGAVIGFEHKYFPLQRVFSFGVSVRLFLPWIEMCARSAPHSPRNISLSIFSAVALVHVRRPSAKHMAGAPPLQSIDISTPSGQL